MGTCLLDVACRVSSLTAIVCRASSWLAVVRRCLQAVRSDFVENTPSILGDFFHLYFFGRALPICPHALDLAGNVNPGKDLREHLQVGEIVPEPLPFSASPRRCRMRRQNRPCLGGGWDCTFSSFFPCQLSSFPHLFFLLSSVSYPAGIPPAEVRVVVTEGILIWIGDPWLFFVAVTKRYAVISLVEAEF